MSRDTRKAVALTTPLHADADSVKNDVVPGKDNNDPNGLQPRAKRQRRRAKADRGLPPDEELAKLAAAYLQRQRRHWPHLVDAGLLPEADNANVGQMVDDFKDRHRGGKVENKAVQSLLKICPKLAGNYNRYSCDNSSPTSALDQMVNSLDKALDEGRFIPWQYIFADYSVTGLDPSRQGYTCFKSLLSDMDHPLETIYIDDFTRASRDELEWWKLAALSKRLNKRMVGASDGFDVNSPDWDIKITIYGLVSRLFIKGLREKVKRGMRGAARRGTCLGKLPLGFTRQAHRNASGNIVNGPDGLPIYEPCIDPATKEIRLQIFELFVVQNWSPYRIARHFNSTKVDGWVGWSEKPIKMLLWSPTAIGVFVWNKTRREYDREIGKWVVVSNQRSEWEVFYNRELAIVPTEWWRAARRKLAAMRRASSLTGKKMSRNQISASTLFSGTLFCEHCGAEMKLIRSDKNSKQMGCPNGALGKHGCKNGTSKSVRVIEECLLTYIRDAILTDEMVEKLVVTSNSFLKQEAIKPQVNVAPMKAEARKLEAKIKKLVLRVENDPNEELCAGYDKRIRELQSDVNRLQSQIRDAELQNRKKDVEPLGLEQANAYLAQLRETLNASIPQAAEAIRLLTGPITIRQERIPGRERGARWIATFSPDLTRMFRLVAPNVATSRISVPEECLDQRTVVIEKVPRYEQLAPEFKRLKDNGASIQSIASAHGMSWSYAVEIIRFAEIGKRPKWQAGKQTGGDSKRERYKEIAAEVVRLRDTKKMAFKRIASKFGIAGSTVRRAYDYARPEPVREAAARGVEPHRGSYSLLGEGKYEKIRSLLDADKPVAEIAKEVGCGASTVYRVKRQMRSENDEGQGASAVG